ncbi:MgtC/SapB family protein [Natronomonas halophila]|uniref:MgtC/SapB family protein n=1 Tax=Natronomonas halophila TaxID=2747817 RepID=UPI0015B6EE71|nr:MgtC/SapB family protein [Natronomonas halophila]QLD84322.1 MgtC/SapB family protein [Natronomonas halophila]
MEQFGTGLLDGNVVALGLAALLGLFLGLEREWSDKSAGVRTFALVSLVAAVFTILDQPLLLVAGALLVVVIGGMLGIQGILAEGDALSLTTSVSLLVTYGVGALVASGYILEGVTVAVVSSLLLVFKQELHGVADELSKEEVQASAEFAILAFVIYPLLPAESRTISVLDASVDIEPRVVWLMVVFVAGIGIANYAIVRLYGGRGIAVTGFFGGFASSTGVVGAMLDHVNQHPDASKYGVAAVLLSNASMAIRNLAIALFFTLGAGVLVEAAIPLGAVVVGAVVVAFVTADWSESVEMDLGTPFTLQYALGIGALFLVVLLAGGFAEALFGTGGLYVAAIISGLVSSAGATASAVVLYSNGQVSSDEAVIAILLASAASILVKVGMTAFSPNREFARGVTVGSTVLLVAAGVVTGVMVFL